jgi:hypothetical protein
MPKQERVNVKQNSCWLQLLQDGKYILKREHMSLAAVAGYMLLQHTSNCNKSKNAMHL